MREDETMSACVQCGHSNLLDLPICEYCYALLPETLMVEQVPEDPRANGLEGEAEPVVQHTQHVGFLTPDVIALYINDRAMPILHEFQGELVLGRYTPSPDSAQRFDLSLYEAFDAGVSRLHASLRRQETGEVELIDLGSTDGTWLNGERLAPYLAAQVNSGDYLRLSRLWLTLYFLS
jgi:hypothetical protein